MNIRDCDYLLISDLDDTLLGDDEAQSRFVDWYDGVRDRLALVYSSGRFPESQVRSIERSGLPAPALIIGGVGTEIVRYPDCSPDMEWRRRMSEGWSAQRVRDLLDREQDLRMQEDENQSRFKVSYYLENADEERLLALRRRLRDAGVDADYVYSSACDLDFLPAGVDKGAAAAFVAEQLGFDHDHVLVSGNSLNDRALMEQGFLGIVVANAEAGLKRAAGERTWVARRKRADGVLEGIRHWVDLQTRQRPATAGDATAAEQRLFDEGHRRALDLLHRCRTRHGFIAAPEAGANYQRIWGRDGSILAIAGLLSGEEDLIRGCADTLRTLAAYQGPHGEIPSNVDPDEDEISYGGTAGRVDADLWFVIACGCYWRHTGDRSLLVELAQPLERIRFLLGCWEYNARGLLYVPQTGDWADEYLHQGYVLHDQLLYLQAQRELVAIHRQIGGVDAGLKDRIVHLHATIRTNYWIDPDQPPSPERSYHPTVIKRLHEAARHQSRQYWLPFFTPSSYGFRFDALANVLASLVGVADDDQRAMVDATIDAFGNDDPALLPAFAPVITPCDEAWEDLQMMFSYTFRNRPYEYHNGGLWPMITGFYVADCALRGDRQRARHYLRGVHRANAAAMDGEEWSFPEYLHGRSNAAGGTRHQGWSAAAAVIGRQVLDGKELFAK